MAQGWVLILILNWRGSIYRFTEVTAIIRFLVVVGLRASCSCWLLTKGHHHFLALWVPMWPLAFARRPREREAPASRALLYSVIMQPHTCNPITFTEFCWLGASYSSHLPLQGRGGATTQRYGSQALGVRVCPPQCLLGLLRGVNELIVIKLFKKHPYAGGTGPIGCGGGCVIITIRRTCLWSCTCSWKVFRAPGVTESH